jgi:predicted nucleic acid-binding protein
MADPLARVAIDTCVVLAVLLKEPERIEASSWVLDQHRKAHTIVVPSIVLAAIPGARGVRGAGGNAREKRARQQRVDTVLQWVRDNQLQVIDIDEVVARKAAGLAALHAICGADSCVISAALAARCETLYTWDDKLLKLASRIKPDELKIIQPRIPAGSQHELTFDQPSHVADPPKGQHE